MRITKRIMTLMAATALLIASPVFASSILSPVTDSVNSGIINTKMATDNGLSHINVDATVQNGIAIFIGNVNTQAQFDELVRIAHSVSGIRGVDTSRLKIQGK